MERGHSPLDRRRRIRAHGRDHRAWEAQPNSGRMRSIADPLRVDRHKAGGPERTSASKSGECARNSAGLALTRIRLFNLRDLELKEWVDGQCKSAMHPNSRYPAN